MIVIIAGGRKMVFICSDVLLETIKGKYMLGILTHQQMETVLSGNITGRIGCYDGDRMYIVPVSYVYNDKYIIAHSREGLKVNIMRKHPKVCFEVDEMKDLRNWKSVIAWGTYEEVTNERERYYAMKVLVGRLMHLRVSETAHLPHMEGEGGREVILPGEIKPVVYRIRLQEMTGRFESA